MLILPRPLVPRYWFNSAVIPAVNGVGADVPPKAEKYVVMAALMPLTHVLVELVLPWTTSD